MKKLEKKCRVCGENDPSKLRKLVSSKGKISLDRLCRDCFNKLRRERHEKNKESDNEKRREHYQDNKETILQQNANWRDENRDKWLEGKKESYANNAEIILAQHKEKYSADEEFRNKKIEAAKEWETNNPVRLKKRRKRYYAENKVIWENQRKNPKYRANRRIHRRFKYKTDIQYKLRQDISTSIVKGLKKRNSSKNGNSCLQFLQYSIDELKIHLESLFESWMTWDNRGIYNPITWNDSNSATWTWQIDHIIPHSNFKYSSMEDQAFKDCWALTNLRPLSAKQNLLDGNRR